MRAAGLGGRCGKLDFVLAMLLFGAASMTIAAEPRTDRPNVVIILADDAALMDFGAYGGEALTPHIDKLAARGALFTQYRTSPLCAPTRAMLLTGVDNHRTGVATIPEILPREHRNQPGYSMALEPGVLTLADRLRSAGYRTLMSGKWHLGEHAGDLPNAHGFDRSLALAASGADNWEDRPYMPYYADAPWFEDGLPIDLPEDFYSSRFIVDKMIEYLEGTDASKPFFAYLPFQAIHIPVQAPAEFIAHYHGVFDRGWQQMRVARHERAQDLGLIPRGAALAPMPVGFRDWGSLADVERLRYAARMEVNAAMLETMDHHIGRFIEYLGKNDAFDNTIFVVTSDNGPEPSSGDADLTTRLALLLTGYHIDLEGMGGPGSWGFIGPEWANAAASPSALFKFYASEGGVRSPLIIAGPELGPVRIASPAMVTDIAPTLLDWLNHLPEAPEAAPIVGMTGRSLLPVLRAEQPSVYGANEVRAIEVSGNAALYRGDYKITRNLRPAGDGRWRLYHLAEDPGESSDLSVQRPELLSSMLTAYEAYAREMGVLAMPPGYDSRRHIASNTVNRLWLRHRSVLLAVFGSLIILLVFWRLARRRSSRL
ncbi:MAG: arylsulfatase A-like enzyme [Halieaceae bacterium]|jgi:arylsulfatase A-like enzyme